MIRHPRGQLAAALVVATALGGALSVGPATAAPRSARAATMTLSDAQVGDIRRAIDEQRLLDAGHLIDQAIYSGVKDPRLSVLSGELGLARGRLDMALRDFGAAEADPATAAEALQGKGIVLARLGRTADAIATLEKALALAPQSWRAWNAIASQHDRQKDWPRAEAAYEQAMTASGGAAAVFNNRGYSRLLQGRYDLAAADFVAALERKPDLTEARTNLRLALAFRGEYARSVTAGPQEDRAVLLNNAGFAAGVRGDYRQAEDLLAQAMKARTQPYERAAENLKLVRSLEAQTKARSE